MASITTSTTTATTTDATNNVSQETADAKIMADLAVVKEKMDLCRTLLVGPTASAADDAFLGVVGFLEACAPRVVELIEAAAQGALSESVLVELLALNDALTALLAQTDAQLPVVPETTPAVAAAVTTSAAVTTEAIPSDDLLLNINEDTETTAAAAAPPTNAKTTGEEEEEEEDPFGNVVLTSQSKDEEFDDFFSGRAAAKQGEE